jgi:multidrug efflux pump subunit AcrA (membrane-fusion protein)
MAVPVVGQEKVVKAGTARFGDSTGTARKYENFLYGVIKTIDANGMVLQKTRSGIDQSFRFDRKTQFIHDVKVSSRENLKVGDQVWVDVHKDKKTGDLYAKKVVTGIVVPVE